MNLIITRSWGNILAVFILAYSMAEERLIVLGLNIGAHISDPYINICFTSLLNISIAKSMEHCLNNAFLSTPYY